MGSIKPIDTSTVEITFKENEVLLSTTDTKSRIKYANDHFCRVAGYSLEEMIGKPHNLVRHPDMPKQAFEDLWAHLKAGKSWMGPVKNRCKNGAYYWVNAYVMPIKDENGTIVEYQSVRTKPDRNVIERAEVVYGKLRRGESLNLNNSQRDTTLYLQWIMLLTTFVTLLGLALTPSAWIFLLPTFLLSAIATGIFALWRQRYTQVLEDAKSIYGNDMMAYIYSGEKDAISHIKLALAKRRAELKAVVGRVNDVALQVRANAQDSNTQSAELSCKLSSQKVETEQVAAAMQQFTDTIQEISKTVADAAQSSNQGCEISEQGHSVVSTTLTAIEELSTQLVEVDSVIRRLVDGSNAINEVLETISSIADQTNLLALNAAIEAARAGEQGRGFAVVAEEVRALAIRTQQSTEEINRLLGDLQNESESAVAAMSHGNQLSQNCVELAQETGIALQRINAGMISISDLNRTIASAIEEQTVVASDVSQRVLAITELATDGEQASEDCQSINDVLLKRVKNQQSLVERFLNTP